MDDSASRSSRAYSVSAARAFPSVDYGVASPTPDLAAFDVSPAAVLDPFDLSGDDDDADDSSQPTPTNTFFAFRNEASSSRPGSRSTSRANSRMGSRAVSPSAAAGTSLDDRDRSTSRVSSRRPSNAGSTTSAAQGSRGPLSAPQLTSPSLFLPLPNNDPLSTLLSKFIPPHLRPPRDIEGVYEGQSVEQLVTAGSWRALARLARDTIVAADPENTSVIFNMYHLRHLALLNLHLPSLHARELALLFQTLAGLPQPFRAHLAETDAIPFGLEVMLAQTKGVDALNALVRRCRAMARRSEETTTKGVWRERSRRVGVVLAGLLIDLGETAAALHLLSPLANSPTAPSYVLLALHRLYLLLGHLPAASRIRARLDGSSASEGEKAIAGALESLAGGQWESAGTDLEGMSQKVDGEQGERLVAASTLSVSQLYKAQPDKAIATLEDAITFSPSAALIEPVIFNLTTLYELRLGAAQAAEKKLDLLVKVAQWEGDGLRPACLKLM